MPLQLLGSPVVGGEVGDGVRDGSGVGVDDGDRLPEILRHLGPGDGVFLPEGGPEEGVHQP